MSTLAKPIYPRNVDGTLNKQGPIPHTAILQMEMGEEHKETTEMAVTNIGRHDIVGNSLLLWVARLNNGTELKVTDIKEQQRDVEEEEAKGKERWDGVDC